VLLSLASPPTPNSDIMNAAVGSMATLVAAGFSGVGPEKGERKRTGRLSCDRWIRGTYSFCTSTEK